jgi:hypothetical protein
VIRGDYFNIFATLPTPPWYRDSAHPSNRYYFLGFRCART